MDNLSTHWTTTIRDWAADSNVPGGLVGGDDERFE
jgi:hypothetical protein